MSNDIPSPDISITACHAALAEIVTDCGEDTEGLPSLSRDTKALIEWATRAVKQLRADYDGCLDEGGWHHKSKPDTVGQRIRHRVHNWLLRIVEWLDPSVCVVCGDDDRMCCVEKVF